MGIVFVDTSAIYALVDETDRWHSAAAELWARFEREAPRLTTTSYVVVETYALLARRLGIEAARAVRAGIEPALDVEWVDRGLHERGMERFLVRGSPRLSLVDAVSFTVLEDGGHEGVFAFDRHFVDAGFPVMRP